MGKKYEVFNQWTGSCELSWTNGLRSIGAPETRVGDNGSYNSGFLAFETVLLLYSCSTYRRSIIIPCSFFLLEQMIMSGSNDN